VLLQRGSDELLAHGNGPAVSNGNGINSHPGLVENNNDAKKVGTRHPYALCPISGSFNFAPHSRAITRALVTILVLPEIYLIFALRLISNYISISGTFRRFRIYRLDRIIPLKKNTRDKLNII